MSIGRSCADMIKKEEIKLSPSILAADFSKLGEEIKSIKTAGCEMAHIDVMDGLFVPNISIGIPVVKSLRPVSDIIFDVHLMIDDPEKYVDAFADAGADIITFHYESRSDVRKTAERIKAKGKKVGISIKPGTPAQVLDEYLDIADMVLVMTVEPGFGGQKFMADMMSKVEYLRKRISDLKLNTDIQVDGGIDGETADIARKSGANVLVAGTYFFRSDDRTAAAAVLRG